MLLIENWTKVRFSLDLLFFTSSNSWCEHCCSCLFHIFKVSDVGFTSMSNLSFKSRKGTNELMFVIWPIAGWEVGWDGTKDPFAQYLCCSGFPFLWSHSTILTYLLSADSHIQRSIIARINSRFITMAEPEVSHGRGGMYCLNNFNKGNPNVIAGAGNIGADSTQYATPLFHCGFFSIRVPI